jgi:hypothetical protein
MHNICRGVEGDLNNVLLLVQGAHNSVAHAPGDYAQRRAAGCRLLNKMKGFADEMAGAGQPLEDEDFMWYVVAGLDQDYNSFVENVVGKTEIFLGSMYSQLLVAEARLEVLL